MSQSANNTYFQSSFSSSILKIKKSSQREKNPSQTKNHLKIFFSVYIPHLWENDRYSF